MSKLIPNEAVSAFRQNIDVIMDMYGIDCTLYVPTGASYAIAEKLDAYMVPDDLSFLTYTAKVFVEVQPNISRLRKLGLYTEGSLPIIAKFGRMAKPVTGSLAGQDVPVDIVKGSWFRIIVEHLHGSDDYTDLEVVDVIPPEFHDAVIWQEMLVAPRRLPE